MQQQGYFASQTQKGMKFVFIGLLLFCISQIFGTIILYLMRDTILEIMNIQSGADYTALEGNETALGVLCGYSGFMIISLIIILVGLIFTLIGRREFGESHATRVLMGFIILIVGVVLGGLISSIPSEFSITGELISSICFGLGFLFILKELLDKSGLKILSLGAIIFVIISAINMVLFIMVTRVYSDFDISKEGAYVISLGFSALMVIPWAIITYSVYRVRLRFKNGELKPVLPMLPPQLGTIYPSPLVPSPDTIGTFKHGKKCPSCDYVLSKPTNECPKCGYYFENE